MELIENHELTFNIINDLLETGCTIPFTSFVNILERKYDVPIIINYNDANNFSFKLNEYNSDDVFTFKFIKQSNEKVNLTKNGFHHKKGLKKLLSKLQNYFIGKECIDDTIELNIKWFRFLNKIKSYVYGGWLYHLFSDCDLNRDIDVVSSDIDLIMDIFTLQQSISKDEITIDNLIKDNSDYVNSLKVNINNNKINFDIHKTTPKMQMECDAFTNILMIKDECLYISYLPEKMSLIKTLIVAFDDIKNNSYTLIKPLPSSDFDKQFRLLTKPYERLQKNIDIKYDFLDYIDIEYPTLDEIIKYKTCYNCSSDKSNIPIKIPRFVVEFDDKLICTHCLYNEYINK
ncbi:hypothetical protein Klosneuvirus_5_18 [Klosneuvirus KNV1]|uniref:Uncharacterized protein n=1 Tax=Klosneuvirus KNV1 TaxID=1977640 RepID=A0A1V0SL54_9VIRU|nr:hypothetical protein Klosneuvirus_5_18 [Klosneuvirus KNV1]